MRTSTRALLAAAALALLPYCVAGVEARTTTPSDPGPAALSTPFDSVIDMGVAQRVTSGRITAAQALVAREQAQMQFLSLSATEQASLLASAKESTNADLAERVLQVMNQASVDAVRQALAKVQVQPNREQQGAIAPKLGADGDLVFVATAGPCRVADSRFWFGPLAPGQAQQVYVFSNFAGYSWATNQGGTGSAGAGNCVGDVFPTTQPVSVVAIVSVINTAAAGALQAWNGGTVLSGGAVLNWLPGERLSNTTVIPVDRNIPLFPGSGGFKRDIAVNNNSGGSTDFVIDVIGFFIENQATALDCTSVFQAVSTPIPSGGTLSLAPPACPTGYTPMTARPFASSVGLYVMRVDPGTCRYGNFAGGPLNVFCDAFCCRVPGR